MKQIGALQFGRATGAALHIDEERKQNARLFTKQARIVKIAHPNGREIRSTRLDLRFMLEQLRDVLAAEQSTEVPQEDQHHRALGPEIAQSTGRARGVGQLEAGQRLHVHAGNGTGGRPEMGHLPS